MGGDDSLGIRNDPVNGAIGVTSYSTRTGLRDEAPMQMPRWYPTATVMPNGDIVVQGGSVRGVADDDAGPTTFCIAAQSRHALRECSHPARFTATTDR